MIIMPAVAINLNLQNLMQNISARFGRIHDMILHQFGPYGLYVSALFVLLLLLIIIIYVKLLINSFQAHKEEASDSSVHKLLSEMNSLVSANDNVPNGKEEILPDSEPKAQEENSEDNSLTEEISEEERKLSEEIVRASYESDDYLNLQQDYRALKQKMKRHAQQENKRLKKISDDLQAGRKLSFLPDDINGRPEDMVPMILNLLSRGVSESKIIQALWFYYQALFKEEDIFQIVRSVRDFIGLCNAGKFLFLPDAENLPNPSEALTNLAQGNSTQCLVLLQALLNEQMAMAEQESGIIQDLSYALAANWAYIMGNIARLNDNDLAHNSFELATELSPKNVKAWNRLGDMYMLENSPQKALISFQNVLDIGDHVMYAPQVANAQHYMASYYRKLGMEDKADELYNESERFYQIFGIRTPLSTAERLAYQTILSNSNENLPAAVKSLMRYT